MDSVKAATLIQRQIAKQYGVDPSLVELGPIEPAANSVAEVTRRLNEEPKEQAGLAPARRLPGGTLKAHFKILNPPSASTKTVHGLTDALRAVGVKVRDSCQNQHGACETSSAAETAPKPPPSADAPHHLLTGTLTMTVSNLEGFFNVRAGLVLSTAIAAAYDVPAHVVTIDSVTQSNSIVGRRLTAGNVNVVYKITDNTMRVAECQGIKHSGMVAKAVNVGLKHVGLPATVANVNLPCAQKTLMKGSRPAVVPTTTPAPAVTTTPASVNIMAKFKKGSVKETEKPSYDLHTGWLVGGFLCGMVLMVSRAFRMPLQAAMSSLRARIPEDGIRGLRRHMTDDESGDSEERSRMLESCHSDLESDMAQE